MSDQYIIAGPASQGLAVKLARELSANVISTENKRFPDGECYLRINLEEEAELAGKDVIIVQTTGASTTSDQNQHIMELIMMISAAKRVKADRIRVVMPYLAYSRQDKAFRPGESMFVEELLRWIEHTGATEFYTIDIHAPKVLEVFTIPAFDLDPMAILAQECKSRDINDPVVICPDKGAYDRSRAFAGHFGEGVPVVQFSKKRDYKTGEITMEGDIDVKGRDVIIADDIIATGGTMARAIQIAKVGGAEKIYAVGTHPLLIGNAVFKLLKAGTTEIIGSDTIDSQAMQASMAKVIADAINKNK
ncbi:MAG: ribose-phosphate diphosphokinase [Promethearchaeota archaeon]